jgi:hypothetical protein
MMLFLQWRTSPYNVWRLALLSLSFNYKILLCDMYLLLYMNSIFIIHAFPVTNQQIIFVFAVTYVTVKCLETSIVVIILKLQNITLRCVPFSLNEYHIYNTCIHCYLSGNHICFCSNVRHRIMFEDYHCCHYPLTIKY